MKARRVSRELALLGLYQFTKKPELLIDKSIEDIIIISVRTLVDFSSVSLDNSIKDLFRIKDFLDDMEVNDPENLERPIESKILPVEFANTSKLKNIIEELIECSESALQAIEIAEMSSLSQKDIVKNYTVNLLKTFVVHKEYIDNEINKYTENWNVERLQKMDRNILRLALTEIKYLDQVPDSVAADEAIELAKKYSSEESPRFINGVLGQFIANLEGL